MYLQSVVSPRTLAANAWNLSPWACLAEWAVALRMPTATGCTTTALTSFISSSRFMVLKPNMALYAVLSSSSEKHSMAWVVNWLATVAESIPSREEVAPLGRGATQVYGGTD